MWNNTKLLLILTHFMDFIHRFALSNSNFSNQSDLTTISQLVAKNLKK